MASFDSCNRSHPIRTAEILCVGTELLLGDIVNTNAAFLSKRLAAMGISVYHQAVVGDHPERLRVALSDAFEGHGRPAADLVILSGGLGPTYDDLTKETVAAYFGKKMILHEESLTAIREFFSRTGRVMTPNNEKQAMMPEGCMVFHNHYGTAPALAVGDNTRTAIMLPGPPAELIPIFDELVVPFLRSHTEGVLFSRNIHIMGLGESAVEAALHDLMVSSQNPTVAPYCKSGEVRLRITAKGRDEAEAASMCDEMVSLVRSVPEISPYIYGVDCDNVETALVRLLTEKGLTLATAESCTGGLIGAALTSVSGSSEWYLGGVISYANSVKAGLLGVNEEDLEAQGAVSEPVVRSMAQGACRVTGADMACAVSGVAGPGGGTPEKPVGTVWIGWSLHGETRARKFHFDGDRDSVRAQTVAEAVRGMLEWVKD